MTLTGGYTPQSGMAYSISATDPDNARAVVFGVSGTFPASGGGSSITIGTNNTNTVTISYAPPATNPAAVDLSGTKPFGTLQFTPSKPTQFATSTISDYYATGIDFYLKITQSPPYPATSAAPLELTLKCKLTGVISSVALLNTVTLTFPTLSNNLGGVSYVRTANTQALSYTATNSVTAPTVTAPDPYRLILKVTGYGPSYAEKRIQMMVNRLAFDFTAPAAVTIRGSDSGGSMTFAVGDSARYPYTGYDNANAGALGLPAFAVTNGSDYSTAMGAVGSQVTGSSQVQNVAASSLSSFLQTAQGARDLVSSLREAAQGEYWPVGSTGAANDRYFPSGTAPADFGTNNPSATPNGLFTFVDGGAALRGFSC